MMLNVVTTNVNNTLIIVEKYILVYVNLCMITMRVFNFINN